MDEAKLFDPQERKTAGFGTPASLTLTEKAPPRKRKLDEQPGKGKLEAVIRVTQRYPHPSKSQAQAARDAEAAGEPSKRRVIQNAEKWEVPDSTSTMINQICFTHRRLEQLLTTFTSKAGPEFIQRMDDEFQKLQTEATSHYKQGLKEKESLTENEHAVEKGLLRVEIRKLTEQIAALNENYDEQIEVSFDLQDQLTTAEGALATLTETNRTQQATCDQLTADLDRQNNRLAAIEAELEATNEQFTELQLQHQGQSELLATTEAQLRLQQLASKSTSPDTLRSGEQTPPASGSTVHAPTSGLYSMVDGMPNPTKDHDRTITDLKQELAYVRRERDELQINMERIIESPRSFDEETLGSGDVSRTNILPKSAIYHQITTNVPPFTTVMQYYHALKGLNLLISRVPLLKPGTFLSRTQFEQMWQMADATARDTLAFMWATGEMKLPTGVMELVTGSPPFYAGRFVLRTLTFISRHHADYYNHTPLNRVPSLKSYPKTTFHQVKEVVKNQPLTFGQALKTLTNEDTTICYEAVQQYTWLQERHPHRIPGPYTIQQLKEYVLRVIREKETAITTRRFGTPSPRTILQTDQPRA
jgi:hypothetical protein